MKARADPTREHNAFHVLAPSQFDLSASVEHLYLLHQSQRCLPVRQG
jgi:hypothetical protein